MEAKLRTASFTFEDFMEQLRTIKKMGPLGELLGMIPGMQQVSAQLPNDVTEKGLSVTEAIINSMTREERRNPKVINASRKRRIANGSGTSVQAGEPIAAPVPPDADDDEADAERQGTRVDEHVPLNCYLGVPDV